MVKVQRIIDNPHGDNDGSVPITDTKEPWLSITLSRKQGVAEFRPLTIRDFKTIEKLPEVVIEPNTYTDTFCLACAEISCIKWGDRSSMPSDYPYSDITLICKGFAEKFRDLEQQAIARGYEINEDDYSRSCVLSDSTKVYFHDVMKSDYMKIKGIQAPPVETATRTAAYLCTQWGNQEKVMPAELDGLPVEDFFVLQNTLNSFRF